MARWVFRCPECRTRRQDYKLFTQHLQSSGHSVCNCMGYHHSHRKGSRYCHENPAAGLFHADRQGADDAELSRIARSIVQHQPEFEDKVRDACAVLQLSFNQEGNRNGS